MNTSRRYSNSNFANHIREVNKNNLLGGHFLNIFAQNSGKIIDWVGSLQFLSSLTQTMCFEINHHFNVIISYKIIHNVAFHEQEC